MSEFSEIKPYPAVKLTPEGEKWLAAINEHVRDTRGIQGLSVGKQLFNVRNSLDIPEPIAVSMMEVLASAYHLGEVPTSPVDRIDFGSELESCIDLERFNLEASTSVDEYNGIDWKEEFGHLIIPHWISSTHPTFSQFIRGCKGAVIHSKAVGIEAEGDQEYCRILNMTPEEWGIYNGGLRRVQSIHAGEVLRNYQNILEIIKEVTQNAVPIQCASGRENEVYDLLMRYNTARGLDEQSVLVRPKPATAFSFVPSPSYTLDMALNPVTSPN